MILPCQRSLFDIPADVVYLNCAYMSPLLNEAVEAGEKAARAKAHPWTMPSSDFFTVTEQVRAAFAQLVHASADDIALIPAASYGIATAAHNLPVKAGEHILVLADEFPSNYYAWQKLALKSGAEVKTLPWPQDDDWTAALLAAINERTAIVATPNCHWTNGSAIDLIRVGARCREAGAALVVDGTQSIGALPFDAKAVDADFVVTAGYKWMMGPYTYSYMYVAPRWQHGAPIEENWIARKGSENFARLVDYQREYQPGARRFDVGERSNFALAPVALVAINQLLQWGVDNVAATLVQKTSEIAGRAAGLGMSSVALPNRAPHMIGLKSERLPEDILGRLVAEKIYVSKRANALRISPHLYNNAQDLTRFFDVLGTLLP